MKINIPITIYLMIISGLCGSCRSNSSVDDNLQLAIEMGHRHALQLNDPTHSLSEHEIQNVLLQVRAKEYQMRQYGLNHAADTYIQVFQDRLIEINDSLAQIIF